MKLKLLFISLFICTAGISQDFIMKKKLADKYFDNFDFYKAAVLYEQLLKSSRDDRQLYEKLASVYDHLNDSKILPDAAKVLDKLAILMNEYPGMKIELRSHTDSRGSLESNRVLSEKRAQKAMEYLLSKGIQKNRLSGKGYSETLPVNRCGKEVPCSEEEHRQNRRTEFKILKWQ